MTVGATPTVWFIVATVAIVIVVDVWIIARRGYKSTISATLYDWGRAFPIIPFALGIVIGHLFWPNLHACLGAAP